MNELELFRKEIDEIDSEIIKLLANRFKVVKKVGDYKKANNIIPLQPWRWQEVLNSRKKLGLEFWISEDFIEKVWEEIHEYALMFEK